MPRRINLKSNMAINVDVRIHKPSMMEVLARTLQKGFCSTRRRDTDSRLFMLASTYVTHGTTRSIYEEILSSLIQRYLQCR